MKIRNIHNEKTNQNQYLHVAFVVEAVDLRLDFGECLHVVSSSLVLVQIMNDSRVQFSDYNNRKRASGNTVLPYSLQAFLLVRRAGLAEGLNLIRYIAYISLMINIGANRRAIYR